MSIGPRRGIHLLRTPGAKPSDMRFKNTAQNQCQTKQLTPDDVSKGIKAFDSDKGDVMMELMLGFLLRLGSPR